MHAPRARPPLIRTQPRGLSLMRYLTPLLMSLTAASAISATPAADHRALAPTPPMGWNSWDAFGTTLNESQARAQVDVMAAQLLPHGWRYFTVDIQWYEPSSKGHDYRKDAKLAMDEFGRLLPAPEKFPSAAGGAGFKPLADYVHARGLKFGIHLMRGIPRQAVAQNTPVKGTAARAADIALTSSTCKWNPDMFGVDATLPAGRAYYDSLFELYASWGVDFVKVDDLSRPYDAVQLAEVEAIRRAIDRCGRPIVFSTSPGETPLASGAHVAAHANLWRISDDFWDKWPELVAQFKRLHDWTPFRAPGSWPDADMLPLGIIEFKRPTRFTPDEQRTMMTLWSIARSPLILGADLTQLDPATLALLTNDEVLAVNQHSSANRQLFRTDSGLIAWLADAPDSAGKYLALFNTSDSAAPVPVAYADLGLSGNVSIRDLWSARDLPAPPDRFAPELPAHGSGLYLIRTR